MGSFDPSATSAIPRQSLASAVADKLRERILRGEMREGEQIRQDALADEFQVSKIPVREALLRLELEGLIKIVANRGAVVAALTASEIEEMFETRAVLESHLLRHALPNIRPEDLRIVERILNEFESIGDPDSDADHWCEWNWAFHSVLYERAQRPVMLALLKTVNNNCDRYTRLALRFTGAMSSTVETHRKLLDAIRTGNPDLACGTLWQHIQDAGKLLEEFIRANPHRSH